MRVHVITYFQQASIGYSNSTEITNLWFVNQGKQSSKLNRLRIWTKNHSICHHFRPNILLLEPSKSPKLHDLFGYGYDFAVGLLS
jgi:hypothetical protein